MSGCDRYSVVLYRSAKTHWSRLWAHNLRITSRRCRWLQERREWDEMRRNGGAWIERRRQRNYDGKEIRSFLRAAAKIQLIGDWVRRIWWLSVLGSHTPPNGQYSVHAAMTTGHAGQSARAEKRGWQCSLKIWESVGDMRFSQYEPQ